MYVVTLHLEETQQTQEFRHSHVHYNFFDGMNPYERVKLEQFLILDNITMVRDVGNADEIGNENIHDEAETQMNSDVEIGSFHDDSSNLDSEDDEVYVASKKERHNKKRKKEMHLW